MANPATGELRRTSSVLSCQGHCALSGFRRPLPPSRGYMGQAEALPSPSLLGETKHKRLLQRGRDSQAAPALRG